MEVSDDMLGGNSQEQIVARMRYLMRKLKLSQAALAARLGLDPSNVSKYLSGRLRINDSMINRFVVELGVSRDWLRDGVDVPFPRQPMVPIIGEGQSVEIKEADATRHGAPVYDIDVTAGCHELSRLLTDDRVLGYVDLPRLNPDGLIVRVSGDSMEPVVRNGGFISIRPISNPRNIFWGRIYVVVMEDYRMVKYLRRHPDPSMVTLHSANPEYDDMEVSRDDIQALFLVEAVLHCELMS